jgi:Domain of unknown function (DUF5004)
MNNQVFKFLLFIGVITTLNACKPEPVFTLEPLGSPLAAIDGTWQVTKVLEYDELRLQKALPILPIDVSSFFIKTGATTSISFKASDKTYTTVSPANALNYLGSGTFSFNNPDYPTEINLVTSTGKTLTLGVSRAIRPNYSTFDAKLIRKVNGKYAPSYTYSLQRK